MFNEPKVDNTFDEKKAYVIPQRYSKVCAICLLLDSQASEKTKWHIFKESYLESIEQYICGSCLDDLKHIRKLCHQKVDDPKQDVFSNYVPGFIKEDPRLEAAFHASKST